MPSLPTKVSIFQQIKGHNFKKGKVVKPNFDLGLPYMVSALAFKFQMIYLRGFMLINGNQKRDKGTLHALDMRDRLGVDFFEM